MYVFGFALKWVGPFDWSYEDESFFFQTGRSEEPGSLKMRLFTAPANPQL